MDHPAELHAPLPEQVSTLFYAGSNKQPLFRNLNSLIRTLSFQINNVLSRPAKKMGNERKSQKRKIGEEESSCSSEEDERPTRKRYPVLSPASSSCHSSAIAGSPKPQVEDSDGGGASVKELEQAMSKHLPALDKGREAPHRPTDFSADTLLKAQQQRSTIQWIGAHHHLSQQGAPLPASTLLRQLYANRESVIRANVRPGPGGPYYAPEANHAGPLPTPPGSEGSYAEQFVLQNAKSNEFGGLVSPYSGGGYAVDYHSAMTPPSSVSPRDKHQQQVHGGFESPVYGHYPAESPAQPLPLKPQPYPVHHGPLDPYSSSLDQSQFYHHGAASFHLYHPSNKGSPAPPVYPDPLKNPANWYSTPS